MFTFNFNSDSNDYPKQICLEIIAETNDEIMEIGRVAGQMQVRGLAFVFMPHKQNGIRIPLMEDGLIKFAKSLIVKS